MTKRAFVTVVANGVDGPSALAALVTPPTTSSRAELQRYIEVPALGAFENCSRAAVALTAGRRVEMLVVDGSDAMALLLDGDALPLDAVDNVVARCHYHVAPRSAPSPQQQQLSCAAVSAGLQRRGFHIGFCVVWNPADGELSCWYFRPPPQARRSSRDGSIPSVVYTAKAGEVFQLMCPSVHSQRIFVSRCSAAAIVWWDPAAERQGAPSSLGRVAVTADLRRHGAAADHDADADDEGPVTLDVLSGGTDAHRNLSVANRCAVIREVHRRTPHALRQFNRLTMSVCRQWLEAPEAVAAPVQFPTVQDEVAAVVASLGGSKSGQQMHAVYRKKKVTMYKRV